MSAFKVGDKVEALRDYTSVVAGGETLIKGRVYTVRADRLEENVGWVRVKGLKDGWPTNFFRKVEPDIEKLETEDPHANCPREMAAKDVPEDFQVFSDGEWLDVEGAYEGDDYTPMHVDLYSRDRKTRPREYGSVIARRKAMPEEPQGDGYIHIAVVLHNGAEASAKRSPNGVWWWEALPASGPGHKTYGSWDDLLDHYGWSLPLAVTRLEPKQ